MLSLRRQIFVVLGMSFFWQILRLRNISSLFPEGSPGFFAFFVMFLIGIPALLGVPRKVERFACKSAFVLPCSLASGILLGLYCVGSQLAWWNAFSPIAVIVSCAASVGGASLLVAWYTYLSNLGTSNDSTLMVLLFASSVLSFFVGVMLHSLSPFPALLPIIVPMCGGLCFWLCCKDDQRGLPSEHHEELLPNGIVVRLSNFGVPPSGLSLGMLMSLCFLGNMILIVIGRVNLPSYTLWLKYLLSIVAIVVCFFAMFRSGNERKSSFIVWLCLVLAFVGGLALFLVDASIAIALSVSVLTTCKTCSELLILFLLVRDSFSCTVGYRNLSALFLAPIVISSLVGFFISPTVLIPMLVGGLCLFTVIGLIAVLSIAVIRGFDYEPTPNWNEDLTGEALDFGECGLLVCSKGSRGESTSGNEPDYKGDIRYASESLPQGELLSRSACKSAGRDLEMRGPVSTEEALGKVAIAYGLTAREAQILIYAFRGYSLQRIAEVDVISINTVKSHWKNLYRKLNVHSRQELIDLVEDEVVSKVDTQSHSNR